MKGLKVVLFLGALAILLAQLTTTGTREGHEADGFNVTTVLPALDTLLGDYEALLGPDLAPYRGHLLRVYNFYRALEHVEGPGEEGSVPDGLLVPLLVAHDIGIWTDNFTWDYIPPSSVWLKERLKGSENVSQVQQEQALLMLEWHHKILPYEGPHAHPVELFRRADLVDFSLGLLAAGLPRSFVRAVRHDIPNEGFHLLLAKLSAQNVLSRPWPLFPMMRL
jgi:hypothetical protein